MIKLIVFNTEDYERWLENDPRSIAKYRKILELHDKTKYKIHCGQKHLSIEYWFEFETEHDAVIFKLTYL